MSVLMQAFHWDCPRVDGREFAWWDYVREKVARMISGPTPTVAPSCGRRRAVTPSTRRGRDRRHFRNGSTLRVTRSK
ncbi:MAG: hypothetical protein ACRELX_01425 [Longimicrobiales bacterium]